MNSNSLVSSNQPVDRVIKYDISIVGSNRLLLTLNYPELLIYWQSFKQTQEYGTLENDGKGAFSNWYSTTERAMVDIEGFAIKWIRCTGVFSF
jgi:hypothetical protein